jgi:hypothetical protein
MYSSLLGGVVTEIEPAGYHLLASMQAKHDAAREAALFGTSSAEAGSTHY